MVAGEEEELYNAKWEQEAILEATLRDEEIMKEARRNMAYAAEQMRHFDNEKMESDRIRAAEETKIDEEREKQKYGHLAHEDHPDDL
eukprot:CAMPEP_0195510886 /NCGR_PEP_ID=MMETSP0794_2-20130614/3397_1 /TAXON_ID=515487 /ORGANISM="Stephanopyxis turris, Strain CCMP 815" /LENGTH=86 /DNA_ID=CAMNT_0040638395 /DNA_START=163 /DNA_END=423 /DNA_ORIENTATION=-